jgi:hypothetical protein
VEGIFPHPSTNSSSCLPGMSLVFFLLVLMFLSPLLSCFISLIFSVIFQTCEINTHTFMQPSSLLPFAWKN